jgi:hypothetical protein
VLDDVVATTPGVFLYHPGKRQMLPKLRAFIDHVKTAARHHEVQAPGRPVR